jgi:hypothetical protein
MCVQRMLACVAGASLIALASCEKDDSNNGAVRLPTSQEIKSAAESAGQSASELLTSARNQLNERLANSQQMYDKLNAEAAQFNDDTLKGIMASLQTKLDEAKANIAKLNDDNQATITKVKSDVMAALDEVKRLYDDALARIAELRSGSN